MKHFIFLMLMGLSLNVFAHTVGNSSMAVALSTVDYWVVDCDADGTMIPDKMFFQIDTSDSLPLISAQVIKGNFVTNFTSSHGGADIYQGAGKYRITVDKNGVGAVGYSIEAHCYDGGNHTETDITRLQ